MNELKKELGMRELAGTYLFANVPAYLYDTFRDNDTVAAFSRSHTTKELIAAFDSAITSESNDVEDIVFPYVLIVALSFKPYAEVEEFFGSLKGIQLQWAKELGSVYFERTIALNSFEFPHPSIRFELE